MPDDHDSTSDPSNEEPSEEQDHQEAQDPGETDATQTSSDLNMAGDLDSPTLQSTVFTMNRMLGVKSDVDLESKREDKREQFEERQEEDTEYSFGKKYVVSDTLGEGRMGKVLEAKDIDVRRDVAIKIIKEEGEENTEQIERFMEEAQVQGQLEHPNIPPVHELGMEENSRVFFSMQKIEGESLREILDNVRDGDEEYDQKYNLTRLLQIFNKICDGLAYAHSKGVIHRDLKPENIMIGEYGEVHLMDWGLSKIIGRSDPHKNQELVVSDRTEDNLLVSMTGSVIGTPAYMSPEQAEGEIKNLDERSDIYSLGGILYRILTLHPPVEGENLDTAMEQVKNNIIVRPSEKAPERNIPPELESVAMKALSRNPADRYQSAGTLKKDITAFLEGRTLEAADYSLLQILTKWYRRNRTLTMTGATSVLIILSLIVYFVHSLRQQRDRALVAEAKAERRRKQAIKAKTSAEKARKKAIRSKKRAKEQRQKALAAKRQEEEARKEAEQQRKKAIQSRKKAEREARNAKWNEANGLINQGDVLARSNRWREAREKYQRAFQLYHDINIDSYPAKLGLWGLHWNSPRPLVSFNSSQSRAIESMYFVNDGKSTLLISTQPNGAQLSWHDTLTGKLRKKSLIPNCYGKKNVLDTETNQLYLTCQNNQIRQWDIQKESFTSTFTGIETKIDEIAFDPNHHRLAATNNNSDIVIWNTKSGEQIGTLHRHSAPIHDLEFSPDGKYLASGSKDRMVILWNLKKMDFTHLLRQHTRPVNSIDFSPDGTKIASGSKDFQMILWNVKTGQEQQIFNVGSKIESCKFTPDGNHLLLGTMSGSTISYHIKSKNRVRTYHTRKIHVENIKAAENQQIFAVRYKDSPFLDFWLLDESSGITKMAGHDNTVWDTDISSHGFLGASASTDRTVRLWDLRTGKQLQKLEGHSSNVLQVDFAQQRPLLASAEGMSLQPRIYIWNLKKGEIIHTLDGQHRSNITSLFFYDRDQRLLSTDNNGNIHIWNPETGNLIQKINSKHGILTSTIIPDRNLLITGNNNGKINIWNIKKKEIINQLEPGQNNNDIVSLALSRNNQRLLSGGNNSRLTLWNTINWKRIHSFNAHSNQISLVDFVGKNNNFAISKANEYKLWDLEKQREIRTMKGHPFFLSNQENQEGNYIESEVTTQFSQRGNEALTGNFSNGKVRYWRIQKAVNHQSIYQNIQKHQRQNNKIIQLIRWYMYKQAWQQALILVERLSEPEKHFTNLQLGRIYERNERDEKAQSYFKKASNKQDSLYAELSLEALESR